MLRQRLRTQNKAIMKRCEKQTVRTLLLTVRYEPYSVNKILLLEQRALCILYAVMFQSKWILEIYEFLFSLWSNGSNDAASFTRWDSYAVCYSEEIYWRFHCCKQFCEFRCSLILWYNLIHWGHVWGVISKVILRFYENQKLSEQCWCTVLQKPEFRYWNICKRNKSDWRYCVQFRFSKNKYQKIM